ncbi:MAG: AAA family ATPase, partial [Saprospiraceae bacterium]|nr:AAA family ATPase [Saprospiraceae bacterium]
MSPEAAALLYRELVKIAGQTHWRPRDQALALAGLLERLFIELTRREQLAFSTLFARISYAGHLLHLPAELLQVIHHFRRLAARLRLSDQEAEARELRLGIRAVAETVLIASQTALPAEVVELLPRPGEWSFSPPEIWDYKARARVVAVRDEPERDQLLAFDEERPGEPVRVRYNIPDRNDNFNPTIRLLRTVFGFPVTLNLLEVDIDQQGAYRPRSLVVEPDYLIDVSAVAECFKENGAQPLAYLVKKFLPYELTPPILLGNIANHFLDRLLNEPQAPFPELLRETFQLFPFVYGPMPDAQVRAIAGKAQKHYLNIRQMALSGLAQQKIEPENCILEPTFYSEQFGLQGRLDLFYRRDDTAAIVELKSGTPFRPNSYGLQRSHFTQTLLYDLLVRSVFGAATDPAKYIFYSGADVQALRFAPTVAPEQWEALQVRNHLVGIERLLAAIQPGDAAAPLLDRLRADKAPARDFLARDFGLFESAYRQLSPLEKKYFNAFCGCIAREQWLAKLGEEGSDKLQGNAALWRSSFAEKQEAFAILSHLEIAANRADQTDPCIVFRKTEKTNPLANFRVGDIAVLYPAETETHTVLDHQVIKCSIAELTAGQVTVHLRYRQFNLRPFQTDALWNLEPDMLDMGFTAMYRSLLEWATAKAELRMRVLNPMPPLQQAPGAAPETPTVERIATAPGFFLLWGPPGTGKTSVMLRDLAGWVLRNTSDNLLLLAYTNRAVDEICEALDDLGGDIRERYL